MRHRLFIAINLPKGVKKELLEYQYKWPELPARWVKENNLHITLVFIGYSDDQGLLDVCRLLKDAVQKHEPFSVNLNKVCYGPPHQNLVGGGEGLAPQKAPRMVWAMGESTEEFVSLKNDLEKELTGSQSIRFSPENRKPSVHITLARIRQWEFRRIEPEERLEIDEEINFKFPVENIELMESKLKKGGAEYAILESFPLGGEK